MYIKEYHQAKKVNKSHIDIMQIILKMKNKKMNKKNKIWKKIVKHIAISQNNRKTNKLKEANLHIQEIIGNKKIQKYQMEEAHLIKKRNNIKKNLLMLNGVKCKMKIMNKIIKILKNKKVLVLIITIDLNLFWQEGLEKLEAQEQ